jgi:hypothetical protein
VSGRTHQGKRDLPAVTQRSLWRAATHHPQEELANLHIKISNPSTGMKEVQMEGLRKEWARPTQCGGLEALS